MSSYFELYDGEDGLIIYGPYSEEEMLKEINEIVDENPVYLDKIPYDFGERGSYNRVIIKGEVIVPNPKTVVKEYEL